MRVRERVFFFVCPKRERWQKRDSSMLFVSGVEIVLFDLEVLVEWVEVLRLPAFVFVSTYEYHFLRLS